VSVLSRTDEAFRFDAGGVTEARLLPKPAEPRTWRCPRRGGKHDPNGQSPVEFVTVNLSDVL